MTSAGLAPAPRTRAARVRPRRSSAHGRTVLARFRAGDGEREVVALERHDGSVLVLDTRASDLDGARVVGRIAPDEPVGNAALLATMYAADERRGRPRPLAPEDLCAGVRPAACEPAGTVQRAEALLDRDGNSYSIRPVARGGCIELRWTATPPGEAERPEPVSLRAIIGALERYEPALSMTELALARPAAQMSLQRLHGELARLRRSPIVLNRALREAVARRLGEGSSLSEIALRCGRVKVDARGNRSGETSWLARRIGRLPESCQPRPTPWIHSDTLALIAREGLCMSPHEVEL